MNILDLPLSNNDYGNINPSSTDEEKLDIVFKILLKQPNRPHYVEYNKLYIPFEKENLFNVKLENTDLVEKLDTPNSYNPMFKLNGQGHLIFDKFESYSNYLNHSKEE